MKKVMFFAMGLCVSLMLWSCKGQSTGGNSDSEDSLTALNNPLRVGLPAVEKFVRVTAEESTEVFMEADVESPWRVTWVEDIESDMAEIVDKWSNEDVPDGYRCDEYPAYAGTVLAVLGEEGDFYKVSIHNWRCDMEYGFVGEAPSRKRISARCSARP